MPSALSAGRRTAPASARCRCRYRSARPDRPRRSGPPSPPRSRCPRREASGSHPTRLHDPRTRPPHLPPGRRVPPPAARHPPPPRGRALRRPAIQRRRHRLHRLTIAQRDEDPAAFLAALGQFGIDQNLHMATDARLALPQHLRQFAHRQLHRAQQRQYAQPRRIAEGAKDFERVGHGSRYKDIFICGQRSEFIETGSDPKR